MLTNIFELVYLRKARIEKLDWERMVETPSVADLYALLPGRTMQAVGRRAKWILVTLDAGWTLAVHLRMSGQLLVQGPEATPRSHVHLVLALADGRRIFFDDERKFGRVRLLDAAGLRALDASFGPEPLDPCFTPGVLGQVLAGRRVKIKVALLDQRIIAGLGNIYASEALWLAKIHPLRLASSLTQEEIARLYSAIRQVLAVAIENQGSTLRNYRNSYGESGQNQDHFQVYDRRDAPCANCGTAVMRIVVGQRSTYFCPTCQPEV
ncbi:MAG: bifunctional DNA-formamidopyrimidine glycosylase/DNA-(apurinic or apyrimidinic site) lyase [Chloroflexaceae bacterium]|nr:bifunctional DNA-formamidopyrimidine glycosylase/DNA-(apurinic or apyrimidinic site) lyase [Chloroflexaceae bacterium]